MTAPEPDGIVWHTSSYSCNGGACVEVGWRTSSYSDGAGACVEVAPTPDGRAGARLQAPHRPRPDRPHHRLARLPHHPHPTDRPSWATARHRAWGS